MCFLVTRLSTTFSIDSGKEDRRNAPFAFSDIVKSLNAMERAAVELKNRVRSRFRASLKLFTCSEISSFSFNVRLMMVLSRKIVEFAVSRSYRDFNWSQASFTVGLSMTTFCKPSSTALRSRPNLNTQGFRQSQKLSPNFPPKCDSFGCRLK